MLTHCEKVKNLQKQIRLHDRSTHPLNLYYRSGHSNTTRSKEYNRKGYSLDFSLLNQVIELDIANRRIIVEPRLTMDKLVKATLPFGLMPPVIPEFKGITVGGAIMGAASESTGHRWGIFFDTCTQANILCGKGEILSTTPDANRELFYGLSGSYGSLGPLTSAELKLIPVKETVCLRYHKFTNPQFALKKLKELIGNVDFLDGMIFSPTHAVIIEGTMSSQSPNRQNSSWYAQHVQSLSDGHKECLPIYDYLFRYDQGAFWMGAFIFRLPFLTRFIKEGVLRQKKTQNYFSDKEIKLFKTITYPNKISRNLFNGVMPSQRLWNLLHKAEKWIQDRLIVQDFCIPEKQASDFLQTVLQNPGTFPMWLCPLKNTQTPQIFAPHQNSEVLINFGIYGCPSYSSPMQQIIQPLEEKTRLYKGRKVLYSRSYYSEDQFWQIYSKAKYNSLRNKLSAKGVWRDILEKVLSQ